MRAMAAVMLLIIRRHRRYCFDHTPASSQRACPEDRTTLEDLPRFLLRVVYVAIQNPWFSRTETFTFFLPRVQWTVV